MSTNVTQAIDDLKGVTAILRLVCQTFVQINQHNHFYATIPATDGPGGVGIPPPEPFEDLPYDAGEAGTRKCFVATKMVDEMIAFLRLADSMYLDEINSVAFRVIFSMYVSLVALAASETVLFASLAGSISMMLHGLAAYAWEEMGNLEFSDLADTMEAEKTNLICAALGSDTTENVRGAMVQVLADAGESVFNRGYFVAFMADDYLHHLWYISSPALEAEYLAAEDIDCADCGVPCELWVHPGNAIISDDGTTIEVQGAQTRLPFGDDAYYADIWFWTQPGPVVCNETFEVDAISVPTGAVVPVLPVSWRLYSGGNGSFGDLWHSNAMPVAMIAGCRSIVVKSLVVFSVKLDRVME